MNYYVVEETKKQQNMTLKSQCKAKGGTFKKGEFGDSPYVCKFSGLKCTVNYACVKGWLWNCEKYSWRYGYHNCNRYLNDGSGFGSWTSKIQ